MEQKKINCQMENYILIKKTVAILVSLKYTHNIELLQIGI